MTAAEIDVHGQQSCAALCPASPAFGQIDADTLVQVKRCLAVFLGIGK